MTASTVRQLESADGSVILNPPSGRGIVDLSVDTSGIGGFQKLPEPTEKIRYVSAGASASDANDGLSWFSAFRTITAAKASLSGTSGTIRLGYGTMAPLSVADLDGNGLTLDQAGTVLEGLGDALTTVPITASGLIWGIVATAQECKIRGFTFTVAGAITAPYWCVGGDCAANGTNEFGVVEDVFGQYGAGGLTVPAIPGGTSVNKPALFGLGTTGPADDKDIANWQFNRCWALVTNGKAVAGFADGNGKTENITENTYNDCVVSSAKWGISKSVGSYRWIGGAFSRVSTADVLLVGPSGSVPIHMQDVGGELGNQRISCTAAANNGLTEVELEGYYCQAYTPVGGSVAGELDTFNVAGVLRITGGIHYAAGGANNITEGINTANSAAIRPTLIVDGAAYDNATPFPVAAVYRLRMLRNVQFFDSSGATNAIPNLNYQFISDTQASPGRDLSPVGLLAPAATNWIGTAGVASSYQAPNADAFATAFTPPVTMTPTKIAVWVNTIGSAGAVVRLGIFLDTDGGAPGLLLVDAGTVVTTGLGLASINLPANTKLYAGRTYWLAAAPQGGPVTTAFFAAINPYVGVVTEGGSFANPSGGALWVGVAGAFPATYVVSGVTPTCPRVCIR